MLKEQNNNDREPVSRPNFSKFCYNINSSSSTSSSIDKNRKSILKKKNIKCSHNFNLLKGHFIKESKNNIKGQKQERYLSNQKLKSYYSSYNQDNLSSEETICGKICYCEKCKGLIIKLKDKRKILTVSKMISNKMNGYINPMKIYFEKRKNDQKTNQNLTYNDNYPKRRKDMINFIAKLKNKYKLTLDSYFLTISLLDNVCSKIVKFDFDLELLTIGCFFIAGKFKPFFPKFKLYKFN